ncbi:MAG TPA: AAA family ATPase, partial [Vicinamibacterales bacterium]|nr:AAA family ATPase [Vicinamibacterales bacterium]
KMYEQFYGLQTRPFELSPDPRFLLLTRGHREALSTLQYALSGRKGVSLLVGDAGTGKTTLIYAALASLESNRLTVFLSNPALTRDEFFEFLVDGFQMPPETAGSKTRFLLSLRKLLTERPPEDAIAALIIDEAQSLSDALLEEVRLLANIETATDKLLSIILVGQPELAERLNQPSLRQIKQRLGLRCALAPLDVRETSAYIATRVQVAGADWKRLFRPSAIETIYERSGGIPRTISVICDNSLVAGFALDRCPIDSDIVMEVCRDLDLLGGEDLIGPATVLPLIDGSGA